MPKQQAFLQRVMFVYRVRLHAGMAGALILKNTGEDSMNYRVILNLALAVALLFTLPTAAAAQDSTPDVHVQVSDKGIVDGAVIIAKAVVTAPAWVVIHVDDNGAPGAVIGYAPLSQGENVDVVVDIDEAAATPLLHAMLHEDSGAVGIYEFPGPDAPIKIGENIVMAMFSAAPPLLPESGASGSPFVSFAVAALVLSVLAGSVAASRRSA